MAHRNSFDRRVLGMFFGPPLNPTIVERPFMWYMAACGSSKVVAAMPSETIVAIVESEVASFGSSRRSRKRLRALLRCGDVSPMFSGRLLPRRIHSLYVCVLNMMAWSRELLGSVVYSNHCRKTLGSSKLQSPSGYWAATRSVKSWIRISSGSSPRMMG